MFNAIRARIRGRIAGVDHAPRARDARVQLRLPSPYGGQPWVTATVALSSVPHGQGETWRLRAHVDGCLRLPAHAGQRRGLPHDAGRRSLVRAGRDAAASMVRGVVDRLPAERLAPLTARRWRSWMDVQLSTAPLDAGADALMPKALREVYGGGLPRLGPGEPRVGVWSGPAGGLAGGIASLALLQLDESDLRVGASGERESPRFNLNASIAQLVEPAGDFDSGDSGAGAN